MNRKELDAARLRLGLTPTQMARAMAIPYDSYKDLGKRRAIQDYHERIIDLLLTVQGTRAGKKYGIGPD